MFRTLTRPMTIAAAGSAVAALTLTACGTGADNTAANTPLATSSAASSTSTSSPASSSTSTSSSSTTSSSTSSPASSSTTSSSSTSAATRSAATQVARSQDRPTFKTITQNRPVAFDTVRKTDSTLARGTTKITRAGVAGSERVTLIQTVVNGKVTKQVVTKRETVTAPVSKILVVGTKAASTPSATASPSTSTATSTGSTAGLDTRRSAMWDRIAQCESGGNWSINTGNGYYGGLQFAFASWVGAGGTKYAPRADLATRAQQITIANKLYDQMGLRPWGCAHAA